ncbi:hypothetical protein [Motilimonas eburnea]|uniref:hypothetical protein n=1 Tax=Motilimonas eburnea TaxID=1737488 RepID=UPI001E611898|nr:hypothetical protein [Motilimonas eburnea]MCE2572437.1 hypothetical protein [Motilimonas eburnea]
MIIFKCHGPANEFAQIQIQALHATQVGAVSFNANDDQFAVSLLSHCRSDSGGHFNMLAGTKPLYVEQWLDYLQEQGVIHHYQQQTIPFEPTTYAEQLKLDDEQAEHLLNLVYAVGGFNKLQVSRFLKQRRNLSSMSTRYSKEDLARYLKLGETINFILQLKKATSSD